MLKIILLNNSNMIKFLNILNNYMSLRYIKINIYIKGIYVTIDWINVSLFLIIIVLCSFSVFCSQVFKKRFEEVIPVTIMGIIFILYLFGLFGILKTGVYFILLISIFLYSYTFLNLIIKKSWKELCENTLTPGFLIFMVFYVALVLIHKGRLLISWDEFSFWGDSVKAMYDH